MSEVVQAPGKADGGAKLLIGGRERFCREVAAGTELYKAYVIAGFKRPNGNANRMLREPAVAARIAYLSKIAEPYEAQMIAERRAMSGRRDFSWR